MQQGLNKRRFLGAAMGTGAAAGTGGLAPAGPPPGGPARARARGAQGTGAAAATGALAPAALAHGEQARASAGSAKVPANRRGIQLYTMRRIMDRSQADASTVLRWLGRNGYTEVETAGHYGWTPAQFRR